MLRVERVHIVVYPKGSEYNRQYEYEVVVEYGGKRFFSIHMKTYNWTITGAPKMAAFFGGIAGAAHFKEGSQERVLGHTGISTPQKLFVVLYPEVIHS